MATKKRSPKTTTKTSAKKKTTSKKSVAKAAAKKQAKTTAPKKAGAALGPYTPVIRAGDWVIVSGQLGVLDGKLILQVDHGLSGLSGNAT